MLPGMFTPLGMMATRALSQNIYTANNGNNTVSKITSNGTVTQAWATLASGALPSAIAIDLSGIVYTANDNGTVSKITSSGTVTQAWATLASGANPAGIAIDFALILERSTPRTTTTAFLRSRQAGR